MSEYCSENIDKVDCNGNVSLFATLPGFGSCREKYMAIAPSQSAAAGFTPRDVFITEGALVFKIDRDRYRHAVYGARGVPRIGPQRDYVRPFWHIWLRHDRNVPGGQTSLGFTGMELPRKSRSPLA